MRNYQKVRFDPFGLPPSDCLFASEPGKDGKPKRTHPWQSQHWERIEAGLGNIALDGTLKVSFPLSESGEAAPQTKGPSKNPTNPQSVWQLDVTRNLSLLGVRCALEHRVETDAYGNARSAWRVSGLQSSLAPSGRDHLLWRPLGGRSVRFRRSEIGRALSPAGATGWLIRMASPGDYEIRSLDGRVWRYTQGLLQSAGHPALGEVHFTIKGGFVREIGRAGETPLLRAEYDDAMRLISLELAGGKPHRLRWNADGELLRWERADGGEVTFTYRDGLLSEVRAPEETPRRFGWAENPGHGRGDSKWPAPVHLASDGENRYTYDLTSKGLVIERCAIPKGTRMGASPFPARVGLPLACRADLSAEGSAKAEALGRRPVGTPLQTQSGAAASAGPTECREPQDTEGRSERTVTIFNPLRHRLEQKADNETLIVTFRDETAGRGAPERIETGRGEILEEYRYDERGQLLGVKRKGEPEISLSYDESGRLMALDEK